MEGRVDGLKDGRAGVYERHLYQIETSEGARCLREFASLKDKTILYY